MESTFGAIAAALSTGLPVLLAHFTTTIILLVAGVFVYTAITPHDELALVREGNTAGGIAFSAAIVALALPLGATLISSTTVIDIVIWGVVALVFQLLAFIVANRVIPNLSDMIHNGNVAAATTLAGIQLAVAIVNAAAMAG